MVTRWLLITTLTLVPTYGFAGQFQGQGQEQGQIQGQLQGQQQGQAQSVHVGNGVHNFSPSANAEANVHSVNVNVNRSHSVSGAYSGSESYNEGNNSAQNVTVYGDEAADLEEMPATPASVIVDACSSGASVSAPGYGASLGSGDPVCVKLAVANHALLQGNDQLADEMLNEAAEDIRRRTFVTRWLSWIPVLNLVVR